MTDLEKPELPDDTAEDNFAEKVIHASVDAIKKPARKVRRWVRWALHTTWVLILLVICTTAGLYFWASSDGFQDNMRRRVIVTLQDATGGHVEIGSFHWDLLHLSVEAQGITIHGLESPGEEPYAHIARLHMQVAILGLFTGVSPRVILREADVERPSFHLIVYPDGTTNQPHPVRPRKYAPAMDTLFDAQIGRLSIQQGTLHIADHVFPLDLNAKEVQLQLQWTSGAHLPMGMVRPSDGVYKVNASLGDVAFAEGKFKPLSSRLQLSMDLLHDSLRVNALTLSALNQTLTVTGTLSRLKHPEWKAQASGQVDLRVLAPYMQLEFTRSGVVTVHSALSGKGGDFVAIGDLNGGEIHYQDPVVDAHVAELTARFHADPHQLMVTDVRTRLAQGGAVMGSIQLDNWLDNTPTPAAQALMRRAHQSWPVPTGSINAKLEGITLDTILVMLAIPQYQHLGLNTVVSGPANVHWTSFAEDLELGARLELAGSSSSVPGEVPVHGLVDATYRTAKGSIEVRSLDARLPHSSVEGTGSVGIIPVTRTSDLNLDLQSTDLSEFDDVLRALGLTQGHRVGAAALPVRLHGQASFHGQLSSSWITPRVEGHVSATNIGIQMSAAPPDSTAPLPLINWDAVDLDGVYTPASITVRHGVLKRGAATLTVAANINASNPAFNLQSTAAEFDENSFLSLKVSTDKVPLPDLLALGEISEPLNGLLSGQVDVQGKLNNLSGTGSVDVDKAQAYGETLGHVHASASIAGQKIQIASLTAVQGGGQGSGRLTGSGSYDISSQAFQVDARGSAIDLSGFEAVRNLGVSVGGKLAFTFAGDGTLHDPHVHAQGSLTSLSVAQQPVADAQVTASTAQDAVTYDLSSRQTTGQFNAHGVTRLNSDLTTQASLRFANFDIGAMLDLMQAKGVTGRSDLEGEAKINGPLAHPEKLSGEASLKELAIAVEGVHLQSKGAVHATLADGVARLDPIEVTGEDTDLRLRGSMAVMGKQQLDLEANGSVNLRLAGSLDPDLIASGATNFTMQAHGPIANPILQGKVEFKNAALALQDFPNGLSQINGTLEFSQNRLVVRSLTAMSGGGQLNVGGYLGFQHGLFADLTATGKSIRIRYPQGVSSLADASLHLQGPQTNLLLSGNVQVTRFAINQDLDIAAFATTTSGVSTIVSPDAPSNHIRFDVHLTSAPQLNFQNAYAKLAGDVDLHLRGTLASPSLLGRISLTEGNTSIGGTKYDLQRGDIYFNNPVRIQPNIDVDATARVEDYDITLGLHGTPDKINVTYRSEPPLPEADVIALLALGRTQDEQSIYAQQQQQAGDNPTTDALLGGALNATVSNRVQRLFGTGAIKVDPNFIGSLGNSSARVTVVEQIGKNLTFTYASNVNTTTQQLIQAEIAINRHVSLLLTQDESGIFSMVIKNRRRFR